MRTEDTALWSMREELAYRLRYWVNAYPMLYMPFVRFRHPHRTDYAVTRNIDLVIEAFGRSGTTFANFAFLSVQKPSTKTAHHTHAAANVITAVKWRIPILVIVRSPSEVALSHMVRHRVSARAALQAWHRFHQRILPYRDQIVITGFDAMTRDFTAVLRRVNQKFGTEFVVWEHNQVNDAQIRARVRERAQEYCQAVPGTEVWRAVALPTPERQSLKEKLAEQLQARDLAPLREKTEKLYAVLTATERPIVKDASAAKLA